MSVTWLCVCAAVMVAGAGADRGGSSLRGALEALQRRQRSRAHPPLVMPDYDLYEFVPPQAYPENDYSVDIEDVEENPRYVNVKLLDDNERPPEAYDYKLIKKKNSHFEMASPNKQESAFRERAHHPNEKLRDLFMDKNELEEEKKPEVNEKDAEYAILLGQLWSKYKYSKDHENNMESSPQGVVKLYKDKVVKKRYSDNWGPIAFKRKRSSDPDGPILPDYGNRKSETGTLDPNYGTYELNDDDKDDLHEEYSIAFQPLDDDSLSDLADEDQYTYDNSEKFPVAKRSSGPYDFGANKRTQNQNKREAMKTFRSSSGTDPKILKELSKIFGDSTVQFIKNPVKRSSDHIEGSHDVAPPMVTVNHNHTQEHNHSIVPDDNSHETHGHNMHHPGISGKSVEVGHEHEHDQQHGNDHKHEQDHKHNEKDAEKPIVLKKKSIDWSDYFGIDKRIKKPIAFIADKDGTQSQLRKQYFDTFNKEVVYPLNSFRRHSYVKRNFIKAKPSEETEIQVDRAQAVTTHTGDKRNADDDSKLDNIDKKLKSMEGLIVDEALHFSANVGDDLDTKEEQEMKEKLLSRLAAAYSLEKMRKALKDFKHSIQTQKPDYSEMSPVPTDEAKKKRVAVKKELHNNEIPLSNKHQDNNDDFEDEQGAGHYLNGKVEEQFSEGYMGGSGRHRVPVMSTVSADDGSCPVLTKIVQRCRGVDLLAGDRGQLFLPLCSLHQICYLCGEAPPTTCDLVFLSEADTTCEGDMGCQRAARSALMALRELHDNLADELDGECEASPCLAATLKLNVGWQRALQ